MTVSENPIAPVLQSGSRVSVVVPCYRVRDHVLSVLSAMPTFVERIYCIDDKCPEASGDYIEAHCADPRVKVLRHEVNRGVGAATITGYRVALADGADVIVKLDGDGQMDPALVRLLVLPIIENQADYTKGNRFYRPESLQGMPMLRVVGNAALSFLCKLSSGYWSNFDPNNGFTAVHRNVLAALPLKKLHQRYFFEADMLFRLYTVRAVVIDIPMKAIYGDENSSLKIFKVIWPMLRGHVVNFGKRLIYAYFLRDFHLASVEWVIGPLLMLFGIVFGVNEWIKSEATGAVASAGTVMLSALPVIIGLQLLMSALNYDIQNVPRRPVHRDLPRLDGGDALEA